MMNELHPLELYFLFLRSSLILTPVSWPSESTSSKIFAT